MPAGSYDFGEEWRLSWRPRAARQTERVHFVDENIVGIVNDRNPRARRCIVENDRFFVDATLQKIRLFLNKKKRLAFLPSRREYRPQHHELCRLPDHSDAR